MILKRDEDGVLMISCRSLIVKVWERLRLLLLLDNISFLVNGINCRCSCFIFCVLTKPRKNCQLSREYILIYAKETISSYFAILENFHLIPVKKRKWDDGKPVSQDGLLQQKDIHFQTGNHNWFSRLLGARSVWFSTFVLPFYFPLLWQCFSCRHPPFILLILSKIKHLENV